MRANHLERRPKKYAARKYVSETHDHKPDVHDRRAVDLPINSRVAVAIVADPYSETGDKIEVLRSVRDDPLAGMLSRKQIDEAQFHAGRLWQRFHENSEIGAINAVDPCKEKVDGGKSPEPIGERQIRAFRALAEADKALGVEGRQLVRDILARRWSISEAANYRGVQAELEVKYIGRRFRECLETLAELWGFAAAT